MEVSKVNLGIKAVHLVIFDLEGKQFVRRKFQQPLTVLVLLEASGNLARERFALIFVRIQVDKVELHPLVPFELLLDCLLDAQIAASHQVFGAVHHSHAEQLRVSHRRRLEHALGSGFAANARNNKVVL